MAYPSQILVVIPTMVARPFLNDCVQAFINQGVLHKDILLIQNGPRVEDLCVEWALMGCNVHVPEENLGVSGSWNFGARWAFERGYDAIFVSNDDIILLDPTTYRRSCEMVAENPDALYLIAGFALYVLTKNVWDRVGEFDEGFWPGYMEDNDYHYRANLLGIETIRPESNYRATVSYTSQMEPAIGKAVRALVPHRVARYEKKWGGPPLQETYTVPWNGGPPEPSLKEVYKNLS